MYDKMMGGVSVFRLRLKSDSTHLCSCSILDSIQTWVIVCISPDCKIIKTLHFYGMSFVSILEKNDHVIKRFSCNSCIQFNFSTIRWHRKHSAWKTRTCLSYIFDTMAVFNFFSYLSDNTVMWCYNTVQYCKIVYKWLPELRQNINEMLGPQKTPHISP